MKSYQIVKVYNNNAILVLNPSTNEEVIFVGKGIGFGKKQGEYQNIASELVEKTFFTFDDKLKHDYIELMNQIDEQVFMTCSEFLLKATKVLGPLNQRIYVVLTDHISFALERLKAGMEIHNPFMDEIKCLYPEEFKMGILARDMILNDLSVDIGEEEIASIAQHLSAAREQIDVKQSVKQTRVIKSLVEIVESELGIKIKRDLTYNRLIQHLRSTIERVQKGTYATNPLLESVKRELPESYQIALKLKQVIEDEFGIPMNDDEAGFMAIHINRIERQ